jgi:hypothetical protein
VYLGGLWLIPYGTDPLIRRGPSFAAYDETAGDVTVECMGGILVRPLSLQSHGFEPLLSASRPQER